MSLSVATNWQIPVKIKQLHSAEAYYEEGNRLADYNNPEGALACMKLAIDIKPDFEDAHVMKAGLLRTLGKPEEAAQAAREALKINPNNLFALYTFWRATDPKREDPKSEAAIKSIKSATPKTTYDYTAQAYVNILEGRNDLAIEVYKQAALKFPADQFMQYDLGYQLGKAGHFAEAEMAYKHAAMLDRDFVGAWIGWGNVLEAQKKYQEAEHIFTTLYYTNNHVSENTFCALSEVLCRQKKYDDANKLGKHALAVGLNESAVYNTLATTLSNMAKQSSGITAQRLLDESLKYAEIALKSWPNDVFLNTVCGQVLHILGRNKEAVAAFQKSYAQFQIQKDGDNPDFNDEGRAGFELIFAKEFAPLLLIQLAAETLTPVALLPKEKAATDTEFNGKIKAKNQEAKVKLDEKQALVKQIKAVDASAALEAMVHQMEVLSAAQAELDALRILQQERVAITKDSPLESYFEGFTKTLLDSYRAPATNPKMGQLASSEDEFVDLVMMVAPKVTGNMNVRLHDKKFVKATAKEWRSKVETKDAATYKQYKKDHGDDASQVGHHDACYLIDDIMSGRFPIHQGHIADDLIHAMGAGSAALDSY